MAKGYQPAKAKETQIQQTERINKDFNKNVDASPNKKFDGMIAKNILINDLYAAPSDWNFYDKLDDNKKIELINSINESGLLSPIIVWEMNKNNVSIAYEKHIESYNFNGNKYMILAGHNRVDAYDKLYQATNDTKYLSIPALIFYENDLNIESAREIIVDTNYVQRSLSTKEKVKSVMYKYAEVKNDKDRKGRTREIVAEDLGISPAAVTQYLKLATLIEPIQELVYENKLNLTSVLKIADKTQDTQQWIYDTYGDVLTNKLLNKIKPYMKRSDIENLFIKELQPKIKTKKVTVDVPEDFIEDFKTMFSKWVYEKTKRD